MTWETELNFASPGLEPRASQPAGGTGKDYPANSKSSFRPYLHIPVDDANVQTGLSPCLEISD